MHNVYFNSSELWRVVALAFACERFTENSKEVLLMIKVVIMVLVVMMVGVTSSVKKLLLNKLASL